MRVHIVDSLRRKNHWYPVFLARKRLADLGIEVRFFERFVPRLFDCDTIIVSSRRHDECFGTANDAKARAPSVRRLAENNVRLVWFDLRDSSGTPQFEVLDSVALYVKQSLLKDFSLYTRPMYGGRIFSDYYHRRYGIADTHNNKMDNCAENFTPLDSRLAGKVAVGWDMGYGYRQPVSGYWALLRHGVEKALWLYGSLPPVPPVFSAWRPDAPRRFDLSVMLSTGRYRRESVAFQRKLAMKNVGLLPGRVFAGKVPRREFAARLCDSKIVLSCFGNGEICFREHEAWLTGAAVMMCDMGHIRVWPDRYRDGETYRAVDWDFSNLADVYEELRENDEMRLRIAWAGQNQMRQMFSEAGLEAFALRFAMIARGINPDTAG